MSDTDEFVCYSDECEEEGGPPLTQCCNINLMVTIKTQEEHQPPQADCDADDEYPDYPSGGPIVPTANLHPTRRKSDPSNHPVVYQEPGYHHCNGYCQDGITRYDPHLDSQRHKYRPHHRHLVQAPDAPVALSQGGDYFYYDTHHSQTDD
jgi:hypothetical protein